MDATMGSAANETNNFEPSFDIIDEDHCNTILVYLPEFRKDELKVQLKGSKVVKISGMREIGENKWSSFQKEFPVSENCDTNKISAKFEDGILYISLPKLIVLAAESKTPPPPPEQHPTPTPKVEPRSRVDEATSGEEKEEKPTIKNDDQPTETEKKEKEKERNEVVRDDHYKMVMNAAGKLKMAREKMSSILLFLFAFALGFYLRNLSCNSTQPHN